MTDHSLGIWVVVLAGGEGNRLKELTTTQAGETIPKQFCSLNRHECLLELALERAAVITSSERVCTVVAAQHRRWWTQPLKNLPTSNIFVQPSNRGTAIGTALALLHIEKRDPDAVVVLLPADHYVSNEAVLANSLQQAAQLASDEPHWIYLLGAKPDLPDSELGYIIPVNEEGMAAQVQEFVEKPDSDRAQALLDQDALWNMFIVAGKAQTLLNLLDNAYNFVTPMRTVLHDGNVLGALPRLYCDLPSVDFSHDVLSHHPQLLKVLAVPPCGWTDLGTPKRVAATVKETVVRDDTNVRFAPQAMYWDLAQSVAV